MLKDKMVYVLQCKKHCANVFPTIMLCFVLYRYVSLEYGIEYIQYTILYGIYVVFLWQIAEAVHGSKCIRTLKKGAGWSQSFLPVLFLILLATLLPSQTLWVYVY